MLNRKHWSVILGLLAVLSMVLTACGSTSTGGNTGNQIVKGGSIVDALFEEPDSLLPELTGETYSVLVDAAIWDPLLYGDNKGVAQPGILTQVPSTTNGGISSDLKTYTLHLQPNLKWSDGTALTSADVKLAADLFTKSDAKGNSLYGVQDGWNNTEITSVTAPDPSTVVITLNQADVTFVLVQLVDAATFTPLPVSEFQDYLTHPQDIQPSKYNFLPDITNGPFKVKERVKGDHITLVKNPNYRLASQGKPYLDQITFQIVPDANTILTGLQAGNIQATYFADFTKYDAYQALSGYKIYSAGGSGYENIIFNFKNPILADHAVRQALTESLDTNQINQKLYRGLGVATCDDGIGTFAHDATLLQPGGKSCYKFDVNDAKQLLATDGWSQPDANGTLTYHGTSSSIPQGTKLELKYSTTANRPTRQETEAIAIQSWAAIGVKIDEIDYPASTYFGTPILKNPNPFSAPGKTRWDIGEFFSGGAYDPDDHLSWTCNATPANSGSNYGYYCNSQVDTLEAQQVLQGDQTQRANTFHQIYKLMLTDIPNMFYFSPPTLSVGSTKLHNYNPSAFGPSETWNVWDWWYH